MDPLTHGLLGGVAAASSCRHRVSPWIPLAGAVGAMAPDLDFLIRSQKNPLLFFEFHRQFTHSLFFIPIGGLLIGALLWLLMRRRHAFWKVAFAATIGIATHGLLDTCTSYGTLLLWPFSSDRFSWDFVSIIDPIYSLVLLVGLWISCRAKQPKAARIALLLSTLYIGFGAWQHHLGLELQKELAHERGHKTETGRLMPSLGNLFLWRSVYKSEGFFHVDALRFFPWTEAQVYSGGSLPAFARKDLSPPPPLGSVLAEDLNMFEWFTEGLAAKLQQNPWQLIDLRFSAIPNGMTSLWGIQFIPEDPTAHVTRLHFPFNPWQELPIFWEMLKGK